MIADALFIYFGMIVLGLCIRIIIWHPKIRPEGLAPSVKNNSPSKNKYSGSSGDWVVQMQKPKKEIVFSGCKSEGEVVKKIILMGYQTENIKDLCQL
jgi:hypothetical protein